MTRGEELAWDCETRLEKGKKVPDEELVDRIFLIFPIYPLFLFLFAALYSHRSAHWLSIAIFIFLLSNSTLR